MKTLLDALAELFPDSSRTTLRQLLQNGRVRVRRRKSEKDAKRVLDRRRSRHRRRRRPMQRALPPGIAILHEDDDVIVILKSNGLLTVATERERETTAQAYLERLPRQKRRGPHPRRPSPRPRDLRRARLRQELLRARGLEGTVHGPQHRPDLRRHHRRDARPAARHLRSEPPRAARPAYGERRRAPRATPSTPSRTTARSRSTAATRCSK